jgi:hypothetical protein
LETAVFVVIGVVVIVFAFLIGSLSRDGEDDSQVGRLAAELEVERRRVHELQEEVDRLRAENR